MVDQYSSVRVKLFFFIPELNHLISLIDAEADKALNSAGNDSMFIPERKKRVVSDEPSTLQPPPNAPAWAVQSVVETGTIVVITCVLENYCI